MKPTVFILIIALAALFICSGASAQAKYDSYLDYGRAVAGLNGGFGKGETEDMLASRLLMRSKKPMTNLDSFAPTAVVAGPQNHYTLQFSSVDKALECMKALKNDENVIYIHQDSAVSINAAQSSASDAKADPYLSWGAKAMGADDLAASITSSGSVTVAVIDTGVGSHPFINARVKAGGVDFTDPSQADGRNDENGHGTHVAGTIVDLTQGVKVNILPVRVLDKNGGGFNSDVCNGIRCAADMGAKVINMSLGGELDSPYAGAMSEERDAMDYALGKGVTVVVAAGNEKADTSMSMPASFDDVIVVAAIDSRLEAASFSNYGDSVDVAAPGVNITSCNVNGGYIDFNGTSMASPHVAAIAAMVKLQYPNYSPARVESFIKANCKDLGDEGWDRVFGCGIPYFATNDAGDEGDYTYRVNEDGALITGFSGTEAEVALPETLGGHIVAGVDEKAFYENAYVVSLTVPGCVKEIGNHAFSGCAALERVTVADGVIKIGDSVFKNCDKLSEVSLPASLEKIGGEAFSGCAALKSLALPDGIETVGAYAFQKSGLTSFTVPGSLEVIASGLFYGCADLETLNVSSGVTTIGMQAVSYCEKLKTLSLPQSVTTLDYMAFDSACCEEIDAPGVNVIPYAAFYGNANLKSFIIPEGVEYIDDYAFSECFGLTKLQFPRSVTKFGESIITETDALTIWGYGGSIAEQLASGMELSFESLGALYPLTRLTPAGEGTLYIEIGQLVQLEDLFNFEPENATFTDLGWTSSDPAVADFVIHEYINEELFVLEGIGEGACVITGEAMDESGLSVAINVEVGGRVPRVVRLDKNALTLKAGESGALKARVLPESADQSIIWQSDHPETASVGEDGLVTALNAGHAVITARSALNEALFAICPVTVEAAEKTGDGIIITAIDDKTAVVTGFTGKEKDVAIPSVIDGYAIVEIGDRAFSKSDIESISIPEGVAHIGEKAFFGCKKLKRASLPESLVSLAFDAFKDCPKLAKVKKLSFKITDAADGFIVTPIFEPAGAAGAYTIKIAKKYASVTAQGFVTPQTDEYFPLTLKSANKKVTIGVLNGEPYAAGSVSIVGKAKRTVKLDSTITLQYKIKPQAARVVITWLSENTDVATVSADGVVTPVAAGKTVIRLDTDIGLSDSVTVVVKG